MIYIAYIEDYEFEIQSGYTLREGDTIFIDGHGICTVIDLRYYLNSTDNPPSLRSQVWLQRTH